MTVAAIIQARIGSSRLPGKVLMRVAGQTIFTHVLARAAAVPGVDVVTVTTTDAPEDDSLAAICRGVGVRWTRGQVPLEGRPGKRDVLAGYATAAASVGADVVMRITSDCPLLDPAVAGQVLAHFMARRNRLGYVSNVHPPSWYDGCDVEVFTRAALETALELAGSDEREHVTTWIHRNMPRENVSAPEDSSALKLSVDDARDLARVRETYAAIPLARRASFGWRDVVAAYRRAFPGVAETRAIEVYGDDRARRVGPLREAFVRGSKSAPADACPYSDRPLVSAWQLGRQDAAAGGYAL